MGGSTCPVDTNEKGVVTERELTLHDVLVVEDDSALLDFRCGETGTLLWPIVRIQLLRFILGDLLYGRPLIDMSRRRAYGPATGALLRAAVHNTTRQSAMRSSVMVMGTGLGLYWDEGAWFNRLTDHFVCSSPADTVVVEDFLDWQWPFPRYNQRVLFHAPIQVAGVVAGRLRVRQCHEEVAARLVSVVRARAKRHLQWELGDERAAYLVKALSRHAAAIPLKRRAYERLLAKTQVKLLLKEEACYGTASVLISLAKEMGITTAEYQHGAVSTGNDAYNFAPALLDSADYRHTLPDYFLGYGHWWNKQINVPIKKLAIGHPHRSEQLKKLAQLPAPDKRDILILGDGIETRSYLTLAREMAACAAPNFRVVFRPHPLERAWIRANFRGRGDCDVLFDANPDVYQSFLTAHAVLSEVSTGLFEAVGLADRIFVWNTPKSRFSYPSHPFDTFLNANECLDQLNNPTALSTSRISSDDVWTPNWRANYLDFVHSVVGPLRGMEQSTGERSDYDR